MQIPQMVIVFYSACLSVYMLNMYTIIVTDLRQLKVLEFACALVQVCARTFTNY